MKPMYDVLAPVCGKCARKGTPVFMRPLFLVKTIDGRHRDWGGSHDRACHSHRTVELASPQGRNGARRV